MGIRRRIVWLILAVLMCRFCVGCGERDVTEAGGIVSLMNGIWQSIEGMVESTPKTKEEGSSTSNLLVEVVGSTPKPAEEESSTSSPLAEVVESTPKPEEPSSTQNPLAEVVDSTSRPEEETSSKVSPSKEVRSTPPPVAEIEISNTPQPTNKPIIVPSQDATEEVTMETPVPETSVTEAPVAEAPVPEAPVAEEPVTESNIHKHTLVLENQEATCLDAGVEREYCEECKQVLTEMTQAPLGHDFVKSVWELPTCQKGGYYNNICSRCGLVECVSQEALPHEVEDILIQEGNCMEDTVIQHVCRICGMQAEAETRYTPYDVHSWTIMEVDGTQINYCERCGVSG